MSNDRLVIVGGGASGLLAAGRAAEFGKEVVLFEKMGQLGRKIGISGKGRCNLTNSCEFDEFLHHFGQNGRFLRQCFNQFFREELLELFEKLGLPVTLERGGRYFPTSGRALDVVRVFAKWLEKGGVTIHKDAPVTKILEREQRITGVICNGNKINCRNVIIATGGKSYPRTGSTGDGYRLLRDIGHTITPLTPSLVPLLSAHPQLKYLAGLELRNIQARLFISGKKRSQLFGEISFTQNGLGGPIALSMSEKVVSALERGEKVELVLDLKPALDESKLDKRLLRDLTTRQGESIESLLRGLMPQKLITTCLQECEISQKIDTRRFPAKTRKRLGSWLKNFRIEINGVGSWDEAIVTGGGVKLKEVNPNTMESKIIKGLFITGELLDIQADTGGYNLQAAFSTGWVAGSAAAQSVLP